MNIRFNNCCTHLITEIHAVGEEIHQHVELGEVVKKFYKMRVNCGFSVSESMDYQSMLKDIIKRALDFFSFSRGQWSLPCCLERLSD